MNVFMTNVYGIMAKINMRGFLISLLLAFILGGILANIYYYTSSSTTKGFVMAIALIPPVTCVVVLLISDNFGAGLAIAGAFALIRFKSIAGTAKEMVALFIGIGIGIACGTGFLMITVCFSVVVLAVFFLYSKMEIWNTKKEYKAVRIVMIETSESGSSKDDLEKIMESFASDMTLLESGCGYSKGKDKDKEKMVRKYTWKLTLSSDDAEDGLIEELMGSGSVFTVSLPDKKRIIQL
ncbi:MAG: DUF4956 domain-containing protein [Lachnospiraceae bacterium]|nr:DUF4956 domain-containing protein [Lachnospiraceae bacterium]